MSARPSTVTRLRARETLDRLQNDAAELTESVARRLTLPRISPERMLASVERLKPRPRHRLMPMLEEFAEFRPDAVFVQIGSHDGQQQDPLRDIVLAREWSGVMVEPVPYVFDRLRQHFGHLPRLTLENVAVGPEDGPRTFYHLPDTDPGDGPDLPIWFDQLGSFNLDVVLAHRRFIPDIDSRVVATEVQSVTFETLCDRTGIERVDVLHTDTEGFDWEILKAVPFDRFRPTVIVYESFHLSPDAKRDCVELLARFDYETFEYGLDTWCLNASTLSRPEAEVLVPLWQWLTDPARASGQLIITRAFRLTARRVLRRPGGSDPLFGDLLRMTDDERRYIARGYDDRTPLPAGAKSYLKAGNARLRDLREQYGRLQLPAVDHHMWDPESVSGNLELRYFRGDNVYVWHYAEHPRAMAMVLFIYLRHLLSRGSAPLLARLVEDGAFGCWAIDVPGHGKVSRDRLDSCGEILFLERELGILGRNLRVLDIGAGYGRLAYRMAQAHDSLADYCCVDAIPESTFLCEYYVGFRGVSPPARVVPLGGVEALEPGSFDLAVNVHSFSEMRLAAIEWWLAQLARLRVPHLFVVPNEADGIASHEPDGGWHDALPSFEAAGYRAIAVEPVMVDPAVRELTRVHDNYMLFALEGADS